MSQLDSQLNTETKRLLAEFKETKYFKALLELCNEETAIVLDALLDKNKPESMLRVYQGRAEEVKVIIERIIAIHKELIESPPE